MLEQLLRIMLEWYYTLSHSYGVSIILLSASVSIIMLPLFWIAEKIQERDRIKKDAMRQDLDEIKDLKNAQEKHFYTKEIYLQHKYHPINSLVGLIGLAIQIPFFIAAYRMLGHYVALDGETFGLINNLFAPDSLLSLGGMQVNVLPFLMTAANLFSGFVYAKDKDAREKQQLMLISALFLVLLYTQVSALVLYWTMNNVFSIGKNYILHRLMGNKQEKSSASILSKVFQTIVLPSRKRSKVIYAIQYLYNPIVLVFLLMFMRAQAQGASYVSNDSTKQALIFFAIFIGILHLVLCVYHLACLKRRPLLLLCSLAIVGISTIAVANVAKLIPTNFVGEGMAALLFLQVMGILLVALPLFKQIFQTSLKAVFFPKQSSILSTRAKKTNLVLYVVSVLTLGIITFVNNPLLIFNSDASYFSYPFLDLLPSLLITGAVVTLALLLLYIIRPIRIVLVYVAFIGTCIAWIFAYLYTPYIGIMEGMTFRNVAELYRSIGINLVELLACITLLIILVWAMFKKRTLVLVTNIMLLLVISIASLQSYLSADFSKNTTAINNEARINPPAQHTDTLSFSQDKQNIIVVLFDGFVGPLATKIFREHPEIAQKYRGFRYYRNTVSSASYTFGMLLAILKGKEYLPDNYNANKAEEYNSIKEAYHDAYMFLPKLLHEKEGYKSYLHNVEGADDVLNNEYLSIGNNDEYYNYWRQTFNISSITIDRKNASKFLLFLSLFKNLPYWAKPIYYKFLKLDQLLVPEQAFDYASHQLPMLQLLPILANTKSADSSYKFFHFLTSHGPYSIDKNLQLSLIYDNDYNHISGASHYYHLIYSLQEFGLWLDWLQAQDIYDNTKIILVSDHGFNEQSTDGKWWKEVSTTEDGNFAIHKGTLAPLLMVKDFNSDGNIVYDNKPMANSDLPYLVSNHIPNASDIYAEIESIRTDFTYLNVKQVSDYIDKQYFEISESAEIYYDEGENVMYYKMNGGNAFTPIFVYE